MTPEKLIYMANQIATAFARRPEDEAVAAIAEHIDAFWGPGMRAQLLALAEAGAPDISPRVLRAAERIRRPQAA
ncbi:formate dehydrogenase subunit delta [Rhodovulum tesquicola]|uniref:Formate dehydrogenase delta subunit n=1 Tax=Rhodovulum steppense TaxID=540251 RepID=A0A4R1YVT1_9RHOB|nr:MULTISPECIES: formate dehydrogenase subunit delta [Rhodovulum]MCO8145430.1 formate dehydrogenase subunit delta [Rhodovulum tesquicola]TCM85248.1 formate dehydrogenase delta subunit [Rhodovulum steppense]